MFFPSLLIASRMPKSLPIIQGWSSQKGGKQQLESVRASLSHGLCHPSGEVQESIGRVKLEGENSPSLIYKAQLPWNNLQGTAGD
jgi:hypothetical protein